MSDIIEKWGELVGSRGFAQIPNYLLLMNQFLDEEHRLSPAEMLVLIQLVGAWWKKDELPFPSLSTLASRVGISSRQAQRAVTKLEADGYLIREKRKKGRLIASNAYNLSPLVDRLDEIARAFPNDSPRKVRTSNSQKLLKIKSAERLRQYSKKKE